MQGMHAVTVRPQLAARAGWRRLQRAADRCQRYVPPSEEFDDVGAPLAIILVSVRDVDVGLVSLPRSAAESIRVVLVVHGVGTDLDVGASCVGAVRSGGEDRRNWRGGVQRRGVGCIVAGRCRWSGELGDGCRRLACGAGRCGVATDRGICLHRRRRSRRSRC